MFRHLTMAIFRLYMKYLFGSYTKLTWAVYMGQVGGGEVGTRSCICHRGWEVWGLVGTLLLYVMTKIIVRSMASYYVCCGIIYTYILIYIHIQCTILYKYVWFHRIKST